MSGIAVFHGGAREMTEEALSFLAHRGSRTKVLDTDREIAMGAVMSNAFGGNMNVFEGRGEYVVFDGILKNHFDTPWPEKILSLYKKYGNRFIDRLDGSFAFAVHTARETLIARDPLGLKPLYYCDIDGAIACASELKGLAPFCSEVKIFPPGHYFSSIEGFKKYSSLEDLLTDEPDVGSEEEAAELLRNSLEEAVKNRLSAIKSDAIVFLSGGLDSSCLAAVASSLNGSLRTFTVGSGDGEDPEFARKVSGYLGTDHREYTYDFEEMLEVLPEVIYHLESFDPPLVRSAIPNYLVSKLAAEEGSSFVFMGEGADELFAGYEYMKDLPSAESIDKESLRITRNGYRSGFQRNDRMSLAFGIEFDVPFMDPSVVNLAFSIPVDWKIHGPEKTEKWILRKAFESELPKSVVWRKKSKFSVGSGSSHLMKEYAEEKISDSEFETERREKGIRSKEELLYYRIFDDLFPSVSAAETVYRS
jgi:asparagine synthase (glutamine-hydrolysing)